MQCASSIAKVRTPICFTRLRNPAVAMRSGEANTSRDSPAHAARSASRSSSGDIALLSCTAEIPLARKPSTWSFMSEINGEMTTVVSPRKTAGAW